MMEYFRHITITQLTEGLCPPTADQIRAAYQNLAGVFANIQDAQKKVVS